MQTPQEGRRNRNSPKLPCPSCGRYTSDVVPVNQRGFRASLEPTGEVYRRMRKCRTCGTQFTTIERVEGVYRKGKRTAA